MAMASVTITPAQVGRPPAEDRAALVRKGAAVRVKVRRSLAIDLAAYGAGEEAHELGWQLLEAMRGGGEPLIYTATVAIPPPKDQAEDPDAPVCLKIPDLDDQGDLFVVAQEDIEIADPQPGN